MPKDDSVSDYIDPQTIGYHITHAQLNFKLYKGTLGLFEQL